MPDPFEPIGAAAARVVERLDPYWYWREKLLGHDPDPVEPRTDMPAGFWRLRSGEPLAVWLNGEERVALRGFRGAERVMPIRTMEAMAESGSASVEAVTEADYRDAFAKGSWADDPPPVAGIGDNFPIDPFEAARLELDGEIETTGAILNKPIETQADADRCATWSRRVAMLAKRADEAREEEKLPYLQASREVDDRWRPIVVGAKELTAKLKAHAAPFLIRLKHEAEEKARRDREEADRIRREAVDKSEAERAEAIRQAQAIERQAEPKPINAGRPNMKISVRTERRALILDWPTCLLALQTNEEVRALIQKIADRAARAGAPLAGTQIETFEKVA